jgi:hypothetical protein
MMVFCQGYCFIKVNLFERIMLSITALIAAVYGHPGIIYLLFTSWLLAFFLIGSLLRRRRRSNHDDLKPAEIA